MADMAFQAGNGWSNQPDLRNETSTASAASEPSFPADNPFSPSSVLSQKRSAEDASLELAQSTDQASSALSAHDPKRRLVSCSGPSRLFVFISKVCWAKVDLKPTGLLWRNPDGRDTSKNQRDGLGWLALRIERRPSAGYVDILCLLHLCLEVLLLVFRAAHSALFSAGSLPCQPSSSLSQSSGIQHPEMPCSSSNSAFITSPTAFLSPETVPLTTRHGIHQKSYPYVTRCLPQARQPG